MTSTPTAVLDIDGTLLDSVYHHTLAWTRAFDACGRPVPAWTVHRHIGMGGDRLVGAVAGEDAEREVGDAVRDAWERAYDDLVGETRLLDGASLLLRALHERAAAAAMRALHERGVTVALASSSKPKHAAHALDLLGRDLVDVATTGEDARESKPHPEVVQAALERVTGSPSAFLVGDAVWDVAAARELGIPAVGVCSGGYAAAELRDAGAVAVYDGPGELAGDLDAALARVG